MQASSAGPLRPGELRRYPAATAGADWTHRYANCVSGLAATQSAGRLMSTLFKALLISGSLALLVTSSAAAQEQDPTRAAMTPDTAPAERSMTPEDAKDDQVMMPETADDDVPAQRRRSAAVSSAAQ